jgi:hypothetical protein
MMWLDDVAMTQQFDVAARGPIRCRHVAALWANDWVPHGPITGYHVAPQV